MSNNTIRERYTVSTGDVVEIQRQLCGYCHNPISLNGEGHAACRRAFLEEEATEKERQRQESCMKQFGTILNPHEHQRRLYPNDRVDAQESYNAQLKREAEARKQEYYRMMAARDEDVRRLELMERQIVSLRKKVARDQELAKQEAEEQKQQ